MSPIIYPFVEKCYVCDGIFKFSINRVNDVFIYMIEPNGFLYHTSLGHLNLCYLNYISRLCW